MTNRDDRTGLGAPMPDPSNDMQPEPRHGCVSCGTLHHGSEGAHFLCLEGAVVRLRDGLMRAQTIANRLGIRVRELEEQIAEMMKTKGEGACQESKETTESESSTKGSEPA